MQREQLGNVPTRWSSPRPTSLKPTASIPACTASAIASKGFLSCGVTSLGRLKAMKVASEPALSGFPVVFGRTMISDQVELWNE